MKKGDEKVINIIEGHLGHKVTEIVPFLSQPASSSSSAQPASIIKPIKKDSTNLKQITPIIKPVKKIRQFLNKNLPK